ncbi:Histone deacetylase hda1, partial [Nowakowskiella sp. JEL0407]
MAQNNKVKKTGLVYDIRTLSHTNLFEKHPECPERVFSSYEALQRNDLLSKLHRMKVPGQGAEDELLQLIHDEDYLKKMLMLEGCDDREQLQTETDNHSGDVYFSADSIMSARVSCGGVVAICESVWKGELQNGIALIRPPGHHAESDEAMGFCFFNNIAIATRNLQVTYNAKRILIVDWDIHHGNGIQNAFIEDPDVLYFSIHRHDNKGFFPYADNAGMEHVGVGYAMGKNVNVPWPSGGFGDAEYMHVFHRILLPIAHEFNPEIVI